MIYKLYTALIAAVLFLTPGISSGQAPSLGTAAGFVLFTTVGAVTNTGISHLTGHVGTNTGSSTGFGNVNGVMNNNNIASGFCQTDVLSLFHQLDTTTPNFFPSISLGAGDTMIPGVYVTSGASTLNGDMILDAQGDPNAVFIFQINGSFSTGASSKVKLINGALACNVFWKVEGMVSMATGTTMRGTIIAHNAAIDIGAADTLEGRAFSIAGAIMINGLFAYTPIGCGSPYLTGPDAPALGTTACYGLFSTSGPVGNSGATHVAGDIGTNVGLTTGYDPLSVTGMIHPIPDVSTGVCASDLTNLYVTLNTIPYDIELLYPAQFGSDLILTPHTYLLNAATTFTDTLYLDAEGNPDGVFVIQINGALSTTSFSKVKLINGTQAKNVFWKVEGAVSINAFSEFIGTIVANSSAILINSGVKLTGRALTTTGALTTVAMTVVSSGSMVAGSITGDSVVCIGSSTTLASVDTGGIWASSNGHATVLSGVVHGVTAGVDTISYTVARLCATETITRIVTINGLPATGSLTGPSVVGTGSTITLSNIVTGGTWSTSNSHATVSTGGIVTGVSSGTVVISYTVTGACGSASATKIVTVNFALTTGITGTKILCAGTTTTLSNSTGGGVWSSAGSAGIITIGAGTGIVSGIAAGTATVTYTLTGSAVTAVITVNAIPPVITGTNSVCLGATTGLSNSLSGGTWSSSNTSIAIAGSLTGIVTGVATGTSVITYMSAIGCTRTLAVTVKPLPAAITGATSVCAGSSATFTDVTTGGLSWTSSNTAMATIGSTSGVLTGVTAGIVTITYTLISGCTATKTVSINSLPAAITGVSNVCVGSTATLTSAGSGTWSSSNTVVATVGSSSGVVTGVFAGSAYITYTLSGCSALRGITVNATPSAIVGTTTVCMGSTTALSDATTGGTWSSDNIAVAMVSPSGFVTGTSAGTTIVSYATSTCSRSVIVTVTSGVSSITGITLLCMGSTSVLADATTGGTWTSSNASVATVSASGIVSGTASGTATITYSVSTGCRATTVVTISAALPAISGSLAVNAGTTTTFTNAIAGGLWTSSNTSVATVDASAGVVAGVSAGTATITYGISSGCFITKTITVTTMGGSIAGSLGLCIGATSTLTDPTPGGTSWTSANTAVATVGVISGVVTGVSAGTVTITHTLISGAYATAVVTVNPLPAVITGTMSVCTGATTILSSATTGGTWSSSNTLVATADAGTGTITGVAAGSSYIYYTLLGCSRAVALAVTPSPAAITGATGLCTGSTAMLSSATSGGAWTSSMTSVATVSSTGLVTGLTTGTSIISYTAISGCARVATVTIGAIAPITGSLSICVGSGSGLSNATTGGTWNSSNPAIATVASTGIVSGVTTGMATITYTISGGCKATAMVTVISQPAALTGGPSVCVNSTTLIASATSGGTWSSSNTAVGTISATGVVTGISAGTTTISYILGAGCYRTGTLPVKALPAAIAGNAAVCVGTSSTLTDPTTGGMSWTSSNPAVATIGGASGVLSGMSVGTSLITFTLATGCTATIIATVNPGLSAGVITGPATVSIAGSIISPVAYTDGVSGGTWSTSNTTRATIGASTGLLTGVSAGAVTVTYTVSNSCQSLSAIKAVTITTPRVADNNLEAAASMAQLYPNPTTGNLTLQATAAGTLTVYTLEGKQMMQYPVTTGTTPLSLPKNMAAGVYMCRYAGDDGSVIMIRLVYEAN